jgi:hypothetical protein
VTLPAQTNQARAGHAAQRFQDQFQAAVLASPGSLKATREQLGHGIHDIAMLDVGGEGQKMSTDGGVLLKSGNAHAINVNALTHISSTPLRVTLDPGGSPLLVAKGHIPNCVRPATAWPDEDEQAVPPGLLPFADGFSNLTMMEGAPLPDYQVAELARVTDRKGWIVLSLSDRAEPQIDKLAWQHNGGTVWKFDTENSMFERQVLPPADLPVEQQLNLAPLFERSSSHEIFDIVQQIRLSQVVKSLQAEGILLSEPHVDRLVALATRPQSAEIDFGAFLALARDTRCLMDPGGPVRG